MAVHLQTRTLTETDGIVLGEASAKAVGRDGKSESPGVDRVKILVANFLERHGGPGRAVGAVACHRDRISLGAINTAYAYGEGAIDLVRRDDKGVSVSADCSAGKSRFGVLRSNFSIAAPELPALVAYLEELIREHAKQPGNENGLMTQLAILRRWST